MTQERIIVRTTQNLSYAGMICKKNSEEEGILIQPSERSNIKVWVPLDEISCIIKINGTIIEGEGLRDECRLY